MEKLLEGRRENPDYSSTPSTVGVILFKDSPLLFNFPLISGQKIYFGGQMNGNNVLAPVFDRFVEYLERRFKRGANMTEDALVIPKRG